MLDVNKNNFDKQHILCRLCVYSRILRGVGMVCDLTYQPPDFYLFCPAFKVFKARDEKLHQAKVNDLKVDGTTFIMWIFYFLFFSIFAKLSFITIIAVLAVSALLISIYLKFTPKLVVKLNWFYYLYFVSLKYIVGKKTTVGWAEDMIISQQIIKISGYRNVKIFNDFFKTEIVDELDILNKYSYKLTVEQHNFIFAMICQVFVYNNVEESIIFNVLGEISKALGVSTNDANEIQNYFIDAEKVYQQQLYEQKNKKESQSNLVFHNRTDSYYEIMGLNSKVSDKQLSKRFRELALLFHPDRFINFSKNEQTEAQEKFKKITEAYNEIKKNRRF